MGSLLLQNTKLHERLDGVFDALLVAALEVLDRPLLEEELAQPLDVLGEAGHVEALVLGEGEDVYQDYVVAINHWEDEGANEYYLAFT